MAKETTLIFDSEQSSACYVDLYSDEPGVSGPLFPVPVPVIGVSGKQAAGKTKFLLDIAGGPIKRLSMSEELLRVGAAYTPINIFTWFHGIVKTIPAGLFRVIALDVAEDVEAGCSDYVWANPLEFGKTRDQFRSASGIFQGVVSSFWKGILNDIAARCETFAFSNHIGLVFGADGKPVANKIKNKGRPVLSQLCSVYLRLSRDLDQNGNSIDPMGRPAGATVESLGGKSRLMTKVVRNGVKVMVPVLPPRMPICTPDAIREAFKNPPDFARLTTSQMAAPVVMTEDERQAMRLQVSQQEAETERLRIERIEAERKATVTMTYHGAKVEVAAMDEPGPQTSAPPAPVSAAESPKQQAETATPAAESTTTGVGEADANDKPDAVAAAKVPRGLKGWILGYLAEHPYAVTDAELFAAMHARHGKDSGQVHEACKQLRGLIETRSEAMANGTQHVQIGRPGAIFRKASPGVLPGVVAEPSTFSAPSSPSVPAVAATPPPATLNGTPTPTHANGTIPSAAVSPWNRSAYPCLQSCPDLLTSCRTLWQELCHAMNWPNEQREEIWNTAILARFQAMTDRDLTTDDLAKIEEQISRKLDALYVAGGRPLASPFRGELSVAAGRVGG